MKYLEHCPSQEKYYVASVSIIIISLSQGYDLSKTYTFVPLFSKYLFSTNHVPGIILAAGDSSVN